jgi:hypothetical protein
MVQIERGDLMSLLSTLLDHLPPCVGGAEKSAILNSTLLPRLELLERSIQLPASTYTNAAIAIPEWRKARDQYLNHIMVCRFCYAPTGRHCAAAAHLRFSYDNTPMEARA